VRAQPGPPGPPAIKIPFAPPSDAEPDADAQAGVEKTFAANDTLGQVMAREGFGSAGANVIAALTKLVDPRSIRGGQKYVVRPGDDGTPEAFEYQPTPALRYLVERDERDEGARAAGRRASWKRRSRSRRPGRRNVESSLYESVQKAGESTRSSACWSSCSPGTSTSTSTPTRAITGRC
jgi:hypothetical protein